MQTPQGPQYRATDITVQFMRYRHGEWQIDLKIHHVERKESSMLPIASGQFGEPVTQRHWLDLLDLVRQALEVTIADLIEPM